MSYDMHDDYNVVNFAVIFVLGFGILVCVRRGLRDKSRGEV